jgi:hypothetical protein
MLVACRGLFGAATKPLRPASALRRRAGTLDRGSRLCGGCHHFSVQAEAMAKRSAVLIGPPASAAFCGGKELGRRALTGQGVAMGSVVSAE